MNDKQVFDDFPTVECHTCEEWWLNRCDGVSEGTEKPCRDFKAIRRVDIPQQIEALQKRVERAEKDRRNLWIMCLLLNLGALFHAISHIMGG